MSTHDLPDSLLAAAERVRRGERTPLDLVEACLARIEAHDAQLAAWVLVDREGALELARQRTKEAAAGQWRGPLHGLPLGIKDIVDVAGWPTEAGSPTRHGMLAAVDATLVTRLRAAGAIVLGKTVTTQFACFDPPPTRNPWNLNHTPGGSSSGSAAAVAAGMCLAAIGSQTGGSIVRPASYCGIAGLKPTWGRVSVRGVLPVSFHLDHPGPLARRVGDLALVLHVIAGADPHDPLSSTMQVDNYAAHLGREAPPRLCVPANAFWSGASPPLAAAVEAALWQLADQGAPIRRVELPLDFEEAAVMHRRIMAVEAAQVHHRGLAARPSDFGPQITALVEEGLATTATDYAHALERRLHFAHRAAALASEFDALAMPATNTTAPASLDTTGDPRFNSVWSYAGLPVVSVPCGLAEGMPAALQFVGPPWGEAALLAVAAWCERQWGWHGRPSALEEQTA